MAIIRYCGSEPKVNQCLKHLTLLLDTKSFTFSLYIFFLLAPSLHLGWIKNECCKTVLLCYCSAALAGSSDAVLCFSLVGPQQSSSYAGRIQLLWPWLGPEGLLAAMLLIKLMTANNEGIFVQIYLCHYQ